MKPVDQDKFYDKEKGLKGNCLQAAVASLLELPLSDVPNFHDCLEGFWAGYHAFLKRHGYIVIEPSAQLYACYHLAFGPSPRGIDHAVIYRYGGLAHDPHHSRAGILKIDTVHLLVPIVPRGLI